MESEAIIFYFFSIGLLWSCFYLKHWRSETFAQNCSKYGIHAKAKCLSPELIQVRCYLQNFKGQNLRYEWLN